MTEIANSALWLPSPIDLSNARPPSLHLTKRQRYGCNRDKLCVENCSVIRQSRSEMMA